MRWLIPILVVLLLGLQYRLWFGDNSLAHKTELTRKVEQQKARNKRLGERNRILAEEVEALRHEPDAIEERARAELGMIMEDERFFLVLDERHPEEDIQPQPETDAQDKEPRDTIPEALFKDE